MIAAPTKFTPRSTCRRIIRLNWAAVPAVNVLVVGPVASTSPSRISRPSLPRVIPAAVASSSKERSTSPGRIVRGIAATLHPRRPGGRGGGAALQGLVCLTLSRTGAFGNHDSSDGIEIAATAVRTWQPAAPQAQPATTLGPRRHLQGDRAVGRVDPVLAAQDGLPRPERQLHLEIVAGDAIAGIRCRSDVQVEVAGRATVHARAALTGQAHDDALPRSGRDLHVEAAAAVHGDPTLASAQQILHRQRQLGFHVVAGDLDADPGTPAAARARWPPEERGEEVAEPAEVVERRGVSAPPLAARAGRRGEVHPALPARADGVVLGALFGVAQDLVGLVDLLESLGSTSPLGNRLQIGMVLAGELAVGTLDVIARRRTWHAQHLVVVTKFHRHRSLGSGSVATTT